MSESDLGGERDVDGAPKEAGPFGPSPHTTSASHRADGAQDAAAPEGDSPRADAGKEPRSLSHEERVVIARAHYERKGYRVHSGLQFGCELVLYADDPSRVHSDFCVHVTSGPEGRVDWRTVQTLVRSMSDFHKTLILAHVRPKKKSSISVGGTDTLAAEGARILSDGGNGIEADEFEVLELAIATEHAPFRHKTAARRKVKVGSQVKKRKTSP